MVDASLTAVPKGIVVGKLIEADWHITESRIHFHHGIAAGQAEYLGMRPAKTSQRKGVVLDALCNAEALIIWVNNQTAGSNIMLVAPRLYIAEPSKLVAMQSQDSLTLAHLGSYILVCTFRNTRTTFSGRLADGFNNCIYVHLVACICHQYLYVFKLNICHFSEFSLNNNNVRYVRCFLC